MNQHFPRTAAWPASALAEAFAGERFVVTAEVSPPIATDPEQFVAAALTLKGKVTALNVTDGAGARAHMSSLVAAYALANAGIEPILQMTCRDRNRLALQGDLLGALALGVRNLLMLSGDDPAAGDQPAAKAVFDLKSTELLALGARMRDLRQLPPGTAIEGATAMLLGAADTPIDPPPGWRPDYLIGKIEAGADFVQTQFCMDIGVVRRYAARLMDLGLAERVRILIGVAPIPSARSARWMREKLVGTIIADSLIARLERAADPRREGQRICVEMLRELVEVPGIAGAHIMAPQNPSAIPEVIAESGVTTARVSR
jgi:methylenetetrahydrofolate reductase (NADPH)